MTLRHYTCEACDGRFATEQDDKAAVDEALALFHQSPATHEMAVVCDRCYKRLLAEFPPPAMKES